MPTYSHWLPYLTNLILPHKYAIIVGDRKQTVLICVHTYIRTLMQWNFKLHPNLDWLTLSALKLNKALDENSSLSYGASPVTWDHTVLPATRHKWTRPAWTPASKLVLHLPTPEGWKGELTWATQQCTGRESNSRPLDHKSDALPLHYRATHRALVDVCVTNRLLSRPKCHSFQRNDCDVPGKSTV